MDLNASLNIPQNASANYGLPALPQPPDWISGITAVFNNSLAASAAVWLNGIFHTTVLTGAMLVGGLMLVIVWKYWKALMGLVGLLGSGIIVVAVLYLTGHAMGSI